MLANSDSPQHTFRDRKALQSASSTGWLTRRPMGQETMGGYPIVMESVSGLEMAVRARHMCPFAGGHIATVHTREAGVSAERAPLDR